MSWTLSYYNVNDYIVVKPGELVDIVTCKDDTIVTISEAEGPMRIETKPRRDHLTFTVNCKCPGETEAEDCLFPISDIGKVTYIPAEDYKF